MGFLAGALTLLALAVPAAAMAGTYTWNLATDFTATAPGANPDHDQYGQTPWSYVEGTADIPSTFTALQPPFQANFDGGLAAWTDPTTNALVGINPGSTFTYGSGNTFPAGQIVIEPGSGGEVAAVGWKSPFSQSQTISIGGTVSSDNAGSVVCNPPTWNLEDQSGSSLASGTVTGGGANFSSTATVAPGASVFFTVSTNPLYASCDATGLSLQITAAGTPPPVTLTSPASGSSSSISGPTFSGAAGNRFGDSSQVTLRVYSGSAASGAPVQSVTVAQTGGTWSTALTSRLALGTYTAQAEQDDIASPADVGLSAPVTFTVTGPSVSLSPLGATPLATSTPTFTGTAGTDAVDDASVVVVVFSGTSASGSPLRGQSTPVPISGQFSLQLKPGLPDGTYTAEAVQSDGAGNIGISSPQTFSIDAGAPTVTLVRPVTRSRTNALQLVFAGAAGSASFDSGVVTVALYKGTRATGKPFGTLKASVTGSTWSAKWPAVLRPTTYTVRASQTDALGHVGMSAAHTFFVQPLPPVIGRLRINAAGRVSLQISCNEPAADTCTGTVLALTRTDYQPLAGGAVGRLTVMFAFVRVRGGTTATITRAATARVLAALAHGAVVPVTISANLRPQSGKAIRATARESLRRR